LFAPEHLDPLVMRMNQDVLLHAWTRLVVHALTFSIIKLSGAGYPVSLDLGRNAPAPFCPLLDKNTVYMIQ
jgi:hypothetical protein